MYFKHGARPADIPAPATPDEVAASFPVPLLAFAGQTTLVEAAVSRMGESSNGETVMEAATLSYTVWRNPANRHDPANLLELSAEMRAQLAVEPPWPLPDWMIQWRETMRYPLAWDAVRTTWTTAAVPRPRLATLLAEHANYLLMNMFRTERMAAGPPGRPGLGGELFDGVTPGSAGSGRVMVDGVSVAGLILDSDRHVFGVGVDLGDRYLTAVVSREWLPLLRLEFATRHRHPRGADRE
ncbi:hypothetical protein ACT3TS_06325 [Specibacter sp. AOP5-B1-6]|uniref:hypothetical protein n=1 Tax=Specibacter sp. AOP5-B1-6 TaxID=3457653 RepID=UPI00402BCBDA